MCLLIRGRQECYIQSAREQRCLFFILFYMKTKIIAVTTLASLSLIGVSQAFAQETSQNTSATQKLAQNEVVKIKKSFSQEKHKKFHSELTEAEKTALDAMTETEKAEFFQKKQSEHKAKKEAKEAVLDKILAGQSLTADEEIIRQEIIADRAEKKARKAERQAQKDENVSQNNREKKKPSEQNAQK